VRRQFPMSNRLERPHDRSTTPTEDWSDPAVLETHSSNIDVEITTALLPIGKNYLPFPFARGGGLLAHGCGIRR
jgi:hypothetical protein